jgi:predicted secreted protein
MKSIQSRKRTMLKSMSLSLALPYFGMSWADESDAQYKQNTLVQRYKKSDTIKIDMPPLADTGNSIPMGIVFNAPSQQKIKSFEIVAPENPNPMVLKVSLPRPQAYYQFATRIRLALSQDVWVIATLEDGSRMAQSLHCVVTLNACFDAT